MTLNEFKNIISYTTDEQYVKYFDEHILLYEFLKNRFAPNQIEIEVCPKKESITYRIIPIGDLKMNDLSEAISIIKTRLFNKDFCVKSSIDSNNLCIQLETI